MTKTAIIGLSCLFPGALTLESYWRNLLEGRDCRTEALESDFGLDPADFTGDGPASGRIYSLRGGYVRDFAFDGAGLDLDPEVLAGLDPSFLWALHAARDAVNAAGPGAIGADAGLILGNYTFPTASSNRMTTPLWRNRLAQGVAEGWNLPPETLFEDGPEGRDPANRYVCGMPAALASRALGLNGPSFSLDAACSSALYAIDLAMSYLRAGKARSMLAGALCAPDPWLIHLSFSNLGAYPPNGISQPFDTRSQGIVTGQGASVAALKLLDHAIEDGDDILCVIDGVGLSNDGAGRHMLAPNPRGQALAYERAYDEAGIDPALIDYIECHATGTPLGDRTEIGSLTQFFEPRGGQPRFGSVKANLGHLLTVAGMSSLAKVAMAMREGTIPATIGVEATAKGVGGLVRRTESWPSRPAGQPRRAAISAFGFGGANAHMIVSAHDPAAPESAPVAPEPAPAARPIAITGMAAHFGSLTTLEAFGEAAFSGRSSVAPASIRRVRGAEAPAEGAFVEEIALDPLSSCVPPIETTHFNPQHALSIRVCEAALKDAGYRRGTREPRNVAVIVALELDLTAHLRRAKAELPQAIDGWAKALGTEFTPKEHGILLEKCGAALHGEVKSAEILSYIGNICAGRISSIWNFTGPSYTISADGLGAAYALQAAQMLVSEGRAEAAVVAAVDLGAGFEDIALGAASPPGEGAGAIVLAPLDGAGHAYALLEHAVLRRGHDRERTLFSLPDAEARAALDEAGIAGAGYADLPERLAGCCAEGTVRGDVTGLVGANPTLQPMAGLIRLVLSLWRRVLPTQTGPLPWIRQTPDETLRAVLGSEGLGGACAAISVIEAPVEATRLAVASEGDGLHFLPVQGETPAALKAEIRNLIEALDSSAPLALIQREAVLAARPGARGLAAALVGENRAALLTEAQRLLEAVDPCMASMVPHQTPLGSYFTPRPLGHEGHVAFVYPGGFNSYPFLGRDLLRAFPDALRLLEQDTEEPAASLCARSIYPRDIAPTDTGALMRHEAAMMDDITTMIVSGASFALIYSDILRRRFGIGPGAEFGYSLGETSMLFATNAWPAQARRIGPVRESELLATGIAGPKTLARQVLGVGEGVRDRDVWSSLVLFADADTVLEAAQGRQDLFVTHVNTPRETVIAGRPAALREFAEALGAQTFRSPVSHVLHCDVLRHAYDEVFALNDLPCMPPSGESVLYTARTNAPLTRFERPFLSENTAEVMCSTVDFRRLAQRVHADGARIFIECGPSATCTRWIGETLADRPHLAIAMDQRGAGDMKTLLRGIARLYAHGVALDLSSLVPEEKALARRATVHVRTGGAALAEAGQAAALAIGARPTRRAPRADLVYGPGAGLLFPEPSPMAEPALPSSAPVSVAAAPRPAAADTLLASAARDLFATEDAYLGAQTALARAVSRSVEIDAETEARIVALLDLAPPGVPANANGGPAPAPLAAPKPPLRVVPAGPDAPAGATPQAASRAKAPGPRTAPRAEGVIWDEHDLLNFADGRVSDVFGPDFAEIDGYPVRVRLPSKPYFFVSRVTRLDAEPGAYRPCSLTTEYDIPEDAWYLVDGQMPPGIAVEAGQSDLLLVAYLGIDFRNRGLLKYRLLDGKLAFRGPLPRAGQTLRFDIDIHSFVWQGDNLLFFFRYKGYVDGELALELESGCAGFFSEEQLEAGGGVVLKGQRPLTETLWKPVQPTERTALDRADMLALVEGRLADVFGEGHRGTGRSMRLPPEMLLMADRVTDLGSWREEAAGRVFTIEAEKDLDPEGWYYRSHFVDDPVLPGSLAAEGATQVLKAYLLANGFHLTIADPEFDSIPGLEMVIRVRGQITPEIDRLRYEVRVIETGLLPRPFIRADVVIWHGSKPLVQVSNLGLRIREKAPVAPRLGDESWDSGRRTAEGGKVLLSELHLAHAAKGDLGTAMGEGFGIYGPDHRAPHIPNGCFQFVDRGIGIDGARGVFCPGATMVNEYDSPRDAWYYTENSYPRMPNCVYLEGALQAAILLGYYLGPTLKYPQNVYSIRNLDGKAVYLADIDTRGQTLRHHETLKSNALVPDSILQSFDFRVECGGTPLYEGWSSFGYFTEKALAVQLGLDNGRTRNFWHEDTPVPLREIDLGGAEAGEWFAGRPGKPHYRLAGGRFRLLHRAWLSGTGGRHGLGYVKGYREVREDDWYFTNHFHRDPVQPGSLGLESMLQSIQLFALANGIGAEFRNPRFGIAVGVPVEWKYRGQILRKDRDMFTETHIREVRREDGRIVLIADADLFNDRLPIYQTTSMSVAITEAGD